jgi:hypothetical protein
MFVLDEFYCVDVQRRQDPNLHITLLSTSIRVVISSLGGLVHDDGIVFYKITLYLCLTPKVALQSCSHVA